MFENFKFALATLVYTFIIRFVYRMTNLRMLSNAHGMDTSIDLCHTPLTVVYLRISFRPMHFCASIDRKSLSNYELSYLHRFANLISSNFWKFDDNLYWTNFPFSSGTHADLTAPGGTKILIFPTLWLSLFPNFLSVWFGSDPTAAVGHPSQPSPLLQWAG